MVTQKPTKRKSDLTTVTLHRGTLSRLLTVVKYGTWDEKINQLIDKVQGTMDLPVEVKKKERTKL